MADLATYQKAADSVYDPQLQAELILNDQKRASAMYNLDEEVKSVEPEYQKALKGINDQTRENEGKLNMLYSQRLGGQFSGLQGNDTGMMYSKAADNRTEIEGARASKLSSIAGRRTLAEGDYTTGGNALRSKYTGMKNQYAQSGYQDAVNYERQTAAAAAAAKTKAASSSNAAQGYVMKSGKSGGAQFYGPGNVPITAAQYYMASGGSYQDVASFLKSDKNGQAAYADLSSGKFSSTELAKKYPHIFGGV